MKPYSKYIFIVFISVFILFSCEKQGPPSLVDDLLGWYNISSCGTTYKIDSMTTMSGGCYYRDNKLKIIKVNDSIVEINIPSSIDPNKNAYSINDLRIRPMVNAWGIGFTKYVFNSKNILQGHFEVNTFDNNRLRIILEAKDTNDTLVYLDATKQY